MSLTVLEQEDRAAAELMRTFGITNTARTNAGVLVNAAELLHHDPQSLPKAPPGWTHDQPARCEHPLCHAFPHYTTGVNPFGKRWCHFAGWAEVWWQAKGRKWDQPTGGTADAGTKARCPLIDGPLHGSFAWRTVLPLGKRAKRLTAADQLRENMPICLFIVGTKQGYKMVESPCEPAREHPIVGLYIFDVAADRYRWAPDLLGHMKEDKPVQSLLDPTWVSTKCECGRILRDGKHEGDCWSDEWFSAAAASVRNPGQSDRRSRSAGERPAQRRAAPRDLVPSVARAAVEPSGPGVRAQFGRRQDAVPSSTQETRSPAPRRFGHRPQGTQP